MENILVKRGEGDDTSLLAKDLSRAKKELGYCPKYDIRAGIAEMAKWARDRAKRLGI